MALKQRDYEAMVRKNGFERAANHAIVSLLEENAGMRSNLKQLDEYLQQRDKVIEQLVQVVGVATGMLDQVGKDQYGSALRLKQLALGVKVDSEAVQDAEANGINASGSV